MFREVFQDRRSELRVSADWPAGMSCQLLQIVRSTVDLETSSGTRRVEQLEQQVALPSYVERANHNQLYAVTALRNY